MTTIGLHAAIFASSEPSKYVRLDTSWLVLSFKQKSADDLFANPRSDKIFSRLSSASLDLRC
jgi:hypothetical protein